MVQPCPPPAMPPLSLLSPLLFCRWCFPSVPPTKCRIRALLSMPPLPVPASAALPMVLFQIQTSSYFLGVAVRPPGALRPCPGQMEPLLVHCISCSRVLVCSQGHCHWMHGRDLNLPAAFFPVFRQVLNPPPPLRGLPYIPSPVSPPPPQLPAHPHHPSSSALLHFMSHPPFSP